MWRVGSVDWAPRLETTGSIVLARRLSCSSACEIFPGQGSNLCLLHWQTILYHWAAREASFWWFWKLFGAILECSLKVFSNHSKESSFSRLLFTLVDRCPICSPRKNFGAVLAQDMSKFSTSVKLCRLMLVKIFHRQLPFCLLWPFFTFIHSFIQIHSFIHSNAQAEINLNILAHMSSMLDQIPQQILKDLVKGLRNPYLHF